MLGIDEKVKQNVMEKTELAREMIQAMKGKDEDAYAQVFVKFADSVQKEVLEEARSVIESNDSAILAQRGVRQLTSKERSYYEKAINAMKAQDVKQAIDGLGETLPETVINAVFDDLRTRHPLLSHIRMEMQNGAITFLTSEDGYQKAQWGTLCGEITKELASTLKALTMAPLKLSAFIPVCKPMLELGPEWLDRYVRQLLEEACANGIEDAIINNLKSDTGPIGMIADLTQGQTSTGVTTYQAKTKKPLTEITPESLGQIYAGLAKTPSGKARLVRDVVLIVSPNDYYTKIAPATSVMRADGTWARDVFPLPLTVVQSPAMADNSAVIGIGYRYGLGLSTGSDGGRIEYSDQYQFLEDNRVYLVKLYGNGTPLDNTAFAYLDITNLVPTPVTVVVGAPITVGNTEENPVPTKAVTE